MVLQNKYVDDGLNKFVKKNGSVSITGDLKMGQNRIKELPKLPQTDDDAISTDFLVSQLNTLSHVYLDRHRTLSVLKDLNMGSKKLQMLIYLIHPEQMHQINITPIT